MGLTLPGVLGRVFAAASNLFQSSTVTGDANPSRLVYGDGRTFIGDGSEDMSAPSLVYVNPRVYVRGRGNEIAMVIRDGNYPTVRSILEIQDYINAPIFSVGNTGGVWLNDNFKQAYGVFGPVNVFSDIYGHLQLGNAATFRITAGPPGNNLTFPDACAELFQRSRSGTQGSWTAVNATFSAFNAGAGTSPANLTWARAWTATAAGAVTATTATAITGPMKAYPCPPGQFTAAVIFTRSATAARSKTLSLVFLNAAGAQIGSPSAGTARTDATTGWTRLDVQAVSPAATAYVALQLTIAAAAAGETHYDCAAGWWDGMTTAQISAWSPPYVYREDPQQFMPAPTPVTGVTGNGVSPIVISVAAGHPYQVNDSVTVTGVGGNTAANQNWVPVTAVTATSVTIAGTGNGAWTSGGAVQMNASALGLYDGAFAGDIYIRSDGPANVVQRFNTCVTGGVPAAQAWAGDPRINSQPARVNWYGGNYLQQTGSTDPDYTLPNVSTGLLHNDPADSVNRGVIAIPGQWNLLNDAGNAQVYGGAAAFTQAVRKKSTGAPYVSKDGLFVFLYGLWDLAMASSAGGAAMMGQLNGYTAAGGSSSAIINTLRDMIAHARASSILPWNSSAFVLAGNLVSGAVQYAWSNGAPGAGGTFCYWNTTTGASFTFTVPADFAGGSVAISLLGAPGAFGGTVTWSGTLFTTGGVANPGPTSTSATTPVGARGRVCVRFRGLLPSHAGLTVTGTITALDAGGGVALDAAYLEGQYPNMTAVCTVPRLPSAAGYAALGGAGSYWNGNAGATGDGDITTMNASLASLAAEFGSACFLVDLDSALQKYAPFFAADGYSMGALGVHAMASQFNAALQAQLPLIDFRNINHDYHDTTIVPVGSVFSKAGPLVTTTGTSRLYLDDWWQISNVRASAGTAPQGQPLIVDVAKNGTSLFALTPANRPQIPAGSNTAVSGTPDTLFAAPGDYLTVSIAQTGTTVPGADLTVAVNGRKIPIP